MILNICNSHVICYQRQLAFAETRLKLPSGTFPYLERGAEPGLLGPYFGEHLWVFMTRNHSGSL